MGLLWEGKRQAMMKHIKEWEMKGISGAVAGIFFAFLLVPVLILLGTSFAGERGFTLAHYREILGEKGFLQALRNSALLSSVSAAAATALAFVLAYTIQYTNVPKGLKYFVRLTALIPALIPAVTYGAAAAYLLEPHSFAGLLLGYTICALPAAFVLMYHSMESIDRKFMVVSRIMGDTPLRTFLEMVCRPFLGSFAASVIQCFTFCFADYGISAAAGGNIQTAAVVVWREMMGGGPNAGRGAAAAAILLIPSVMNVGLLYYLGQHSVPGGSYFSEEIRPGRIRDISCGLLSCLILAPVVCMTAVILVVPLTEGQPGQLHFTAKYISETFSDPSLRRACGNSLLTAALSALIGSLTAYGAALAAKRSGLGGRLKGAVESTALAAHAVSGVTMGAAFLLAFSGTPLEDTWLLLAVCNAVLFFPVPYKMMKSSLAGMNASWEPTALLMGDTWLETVVRVVTPNAMLALLRAFSYCFVNAVTAVNAAVFIAGARTMVITTEINVLQEQMRFHEIFALSLLALTVNLAVGSVPWYLEMHRKHAGESERLVKNPHTAAGRRIDW